MFTEKRYRVKFNSIKKYLLLIKQKQKNSKIPKRIWMKPCSKTRSNKSTCANIFSELPLTILFQHYLEMNATSWSYINFCTLITYNYILTDTYNSDTAAGAEFISSSLSWGVLKNFCKFHREAPVLESLFCKVSSLQVCNVSKRYSYTGVFL